MFARIIIANPRVHLIGVMLLGCLTGCQGGQDGDPNRATVSGAVTIDGKPLPAGTLIFSAADSNLAATVSVKDGGSYATESVPIGPTIVTVDTSSIKYGNPAKYVRIPAKYADPSQSGLEANIKPGVNDNVNFDLKK